MGMNRQTSKVLCANRVGPIVRVAVQVSRGRNVEKVVIVDVEPGRTRYDQGRGVTIDDVLAAARGRAEYTTLSEPGTKIFGAAFDGIDLDDKTATFKGIRTDDDNPGTHPYRLPDGRTVQIDKTAAKDAEKVSFTLKGGEIVDAVRVEGVRP